uniref:Uncharacterized protein n=1 Tax=Rhizophora mucronata TaxID=61149 RepID=A0A2P2N243_RHIMU
MFWLAIGDIVEAYFVLIKSMQQQQWKNNGCTLCPLRCD